MREDEHQSMVIDTAKRFAKTLDAEDYVAAAALLSEDCEYTCRGSVYCGPSAIIDSYRGNGDTAKTSFGSVKYESAVRCLTARTAMIRFTDHLQHNHQCLTFECEQLIEVDERQSIVRIEHFDLRGQTEALADFKLRVGVA